MFLINQHLFSNTPDVGNDVLFDALVNKATVLGYTLPSANTLSALNTLIKDMRRIGMIQRLDLFHVYASDLEEEKYFRLMNIVNPEMIGTVGGGTAGVINWSNEGNKSNFTGLASTRAWINTGFLPSLGGYNFQRNNACLGAVVYEESVNHPRLMGLSLNANILEVGCLITNKDSAIQRINNNLSNDTSNNLSSIVDMSGTGLTILQRLDDVNVDAIKRHNLMHSTATSAPIQSAELRLHNSTNIATTLPLYYGNNGISCAFAGASIPFEMAQNFRQVYNKYLRSIGLIQVA